MAESIGNKGLVKNQRITVVLTETDAENALNGHDLKRECYNYARQTFQGKRYLNKATGREISVSKDGLGEWKTKSKSREQILSIKILDHLLENAAHTHDAQDTKGRKNIEKHSYFIQKCRINGKDHNAVITIRKIKNCGDKYYHHYLEDIKIEPRSGLSRPADKTG